MYDVFRAWLEKYTPLLTMVLYSYLRIIVDHNNPQFTTLRQKEVDFCIGLLREKVNLSCWKFSFSVISVLWKMPKALAQVCRDHNQHCWTDLFCIITWWQEDYWCCCDHEFDAECPFWDQASLNNTKLRSPVIMRALWCVIDMVKLWQNLYANKLCWVWWHLTEVILTKHIRASSNIG